MSFKFDAARLLSMMPPLKELDKTPSAPAEQQFSSRQYVTKVLQNLNSMRQSSAFCDVEIVAGDKILKVTIKYQPLSDVEGRALGRGFYIVCRLVLMIHVL